MLRTRCDRIYSCRQPRNRHGAWRLARSNDWDGSTGTGLDNSSSSQWGVFSRRRRLKHPAIFTRDHLPRHFIQR